ncbi:MAG: DUF2460 domain-containing protein [Pseudomonadota bacterium]
MNFHDVRFPTNLSFGAVGGPQAKTEIVTLVNGFEERNSPWSASRRRYDAGLSMRTVDELAEAIAFFEARRGPLYGFRWKDWSDFKSCAPSQNPHFGDQDIAVGDDVNMVFQLKKTYRSGAFLHAREIRKPVQNTVLIGISGDELTNSELYKVDYGSGQVTLSEPLPEGATLTAGFEFDVPVRFEEDHLDVTVASFEAGHVPSIPVVELRQ